MLIPVRGVAVNVGEQTGDGRYIVPGAVTFAEPPLPLSWLTDGDQHTDLVTRAPNVGTLNTLAQVGGGVAFEGVVDDQIPEGAELVRRMREGTASNGHRQFVSIDPDDWAVQLVDPSGDGGGMFIFAAAGQVAEGDTFDWESPRRALASLTAAAGDGDPLADGGMTVMEDSSDDLVARFTRLRIRGLTACSVSAFTGAYMELVPVNEPQPVLDAPTPVSGDSVGVAASGQTTVTLPAATFTVATSGSLAEWGRQGFAAIPVHHTATTDATWDGGAAKKNADSPAALRYISAWVDSNGDPEAKSSYKFPHHATQGGPANMNGVRNALSRLPQADIPDGDRAGVERHLQAHLKDGGGGESSNASAVRFDVDVVEHEYVDPDDDGFCEYCLAVDAQGNCTVQCGLSPALHNMVIDPDRAADEAEEADEQQGVTASAHRTVNPRLVAPPLDWFKNPRFKMPTPMTFTREGRVMGHFAAKNSCHSGFPDRCVPPPMGASYDRFHVGETICDDGTRVATGVMAWGIPHADLTLSMIEAWAHYADSRHAFARVVCGEDAYGIWFSGAIYPHIDENDLVLLRSLAPSGDWRRDPRTRQLSLIAALAVNFPGFPVPRAIVASSGERIVADWEMRADEPRMQLDGDEIQTLVAAGIVPPRMAGGCDECDEGDPRVAALEDQVASMTRLIKPLLPLIAEHIDEIAGPIPEPKMTQEQVRELIHRLSARPSTDESTTEA